MRNLQFFLSYSKKCSLKSINTTILWIVCLDSTSHMVYRKKISFIWGKYILRKLNSKMTEDDKNEKFAIFLSYSKKCSLKSINTTILWIEFLDSPSHIMVYRKKISFIWGKYIPGKLNSKLAENYKNEN